MCTTTFDDNHIRYDVTSVLIEATVDLTHIMLFRTFSQTFKTQRFRISHNIGAQDVQDDARRGFLIPLTYDVATETM